MTCIFCDIIAGKLAGSFVYRDDRVAAFMDIQPVNAGHVLVVPINHAVGLEDLKKEDGEAVFAAAQRVARALRKSGLRCEGVNLFLADGEAAMQEVFHLHLHVFPRFAGDGFGLKFSEAYSQKPPWASLEAGALAISDALKTEPNQALQPTAPSGRG
ncbi:MAG: HIT family protein [Lacunisphaera sp.]|nr:HIT family protein [Lacunisphaera sp.]